MRAARQEFWLTRHFVRGSRAIIGLRSRRAAADGKEGLGKGEMARSQNGVGLPDLDQAKSAVLNSLSSYSTKVWACMVDADPGKALHPRAG